MLGDLRRLLIPLAQQSCLVGLQYLQLLLGLVDAAGGAGDRGAALGDLPVDIAQLLLELDALAVCQIQPGIEVVERLDDAR